MPPPSSYPPPLIFAPKATHKTTLIVLHGRGSTAEKFAGPLLTHPTSPTLESFHAHFPHTKFIFPTAPLRRAASFNRSLTHQWFDTWSLTDPEIKQHLQVPGLRETSGYLHDMLATEIKDVSARNVGVVGLSQGCAASMVAAMVWKGEAFGCVVGMCGYLPLRRGMRDAVVDVGCEGDDGEEDMFERDDEETDKGTKFERAVEWLREELQMTRGGVEEKTPAMQSIPIFLGHGVEDEKVLCHIGRSAAEFLGELDVGVTWKEYDGLGHWYSEEMLRDVVAFLKSLKGWEDDDPAAS
jgi:predicted esterase